MNDQSVSTKDIVSPTVLKKGRLSGLQLRITMSYTIITLFTLIIVEGLNIGILSIITTDQQLSLLTFDSSLMGSLWLLGLLLLLLPLIGSGFGFITTQSMLGRLQKLAFAAVKISDGDYQHRLTIGKPDEIGVLEDRFNWMTQQLYDSLTRCQKLAARNALLGERARISRELHDAISQDLFSLRMAIGGLKTALGSNNSSLDPYIETLQEIAVHMNREMRALLLELRPLQLEHLGLPAALEELIATYHTRLDVEVQSVINVGKLSPGVEHMFLRVIQESLNNAIRHSEASKITLSLVTKPEAIECVIIDNGKGFDIKEAKHRRGLGLSLMQERVQEFHGNFSLSTQVGQGTKIVISLPQEYTHD